MANTLFLYLKKLLPIGVVLLLSSCVRNKINHRNQQHINTFIDNNTGVIIAHYDTLFVIMDGINYNITYHTY